ncbi:MAG: MgtC/SapB family protein [Actinomycetota bacterium]|jgi:putative Mg2+ transporter-C (MgtC) family protein
MDLQVQLAVIGRIALAAFLGYLLGLDRALRGKDAGDRTFSLVALGSAAFVALGVELFPDSGDRVIQGVVAGVGFLGGGLIFRASGGVKGLTTAAALWASAAVGCLVGAGFYLSGAALAGIILVVLELHAVGFLRRISGRRRARDHDTEPESEQSG